MLLHTENYGTSASAMTAMVCGLHLELGSIVTCGLHMQLVIRVLPAATCMCGGHSVGSVRLLEKG